MLDSGQVLVFDEKRELKFHSAVERFELVYCLESRSEDTRSDASRRTMHLKKNSDFTAVCSAVLSKHGKLRD